MPKVPRTQYKSMTKALQNADNLPRANPAKIKLVKGGGKYVSL